ncbi:hypothetical protein H0H93_002163 [Arthromyces matolae]|nr:hypothetical protein H0H93_002163 [Arthromyces matolae]
MNNTWVSIDECHSKFYDLEKLGIDTPWPMDTFEYEFKLLPAVSRDTLKGFLHNTIPEGFSILALHAKASVLLEQATVYAATTSQLQQVPSDTSSIHEFERLEALIEQMKGHFPLLDETGLTSSEEETLLITKMMVHAATIKLHLPSVVRNGTLSLQQALSAATKIVILTRDFQPSHSIHVDPIVGVVWTTACEALIREVLRTASHPARHNSSEGQTLLHTLSSHMTRVSHNNEFLSKVPPFALAVIDLTNPLDFLLKRIRTRYPAIPQW